VLPGFPGSTSVSALRVYDGVAPDGLAGGSPHLHVVSTEAYLVTAGRGRLQVIDADGFRELPLESGAMVWFGPGVVHRAVNDGGLEARVLMSNAGLPEAGDAVLVFPDEVLADAERYREASTLPEASEREREVAALKRRDLAVDGFLVLREAVERRDPAPYARLLERATALVAPRASEWLTAFEREVAAEVDATRARLAAVALGAFGAPGVARVAATAPALGMCGRLTRYVSATDASGSTPDAPPRAARDAATADGSRTHAAGPEASALDTLTNRKDPHQ
jgi:mannose-6-phosphate isomerase-like protein (cupin superfamily)